MAETITMLQVEYPPIKKSFQEKEWMESQITF